MTTEKSNNPVLDLADAIQRLHNEDKIDWLQADELLRLVALATATPPVNHQEIDHHDRAKHAKILALRTLLHPAIKTLSAILHSGEALDPGEQWTLLMGTDCGFEARLIVQLDRLGDCPPEVKQDIEEQKDIARRIVAEVFDPKPNEPIH